MRRRIALATFGILALELALIRWTAGQIRVFAYFSNLVLIGAFLGMGLGVALGSRRRTLHHWTLPVLALVATPVAFAERLGLVHMKFPDTSVMLWGAESGGKTPLGAMLVLGVFLALYTGIVLVFLLAGSALGALFAATDPLRAYSADLAGSLCGVLAMTALTPLGAGPPVWLLLGALPFACLSRRPLSWLALGVVVALGAVSVQGAMFSPYNRIDLRRDQGVLEVDVNRDFHQYIRDLSDQNLRAQAAGTPAQADLLRMRRIYDAPFVISRARGRALVVGAGTGNDVAAALRNGYGSVVSVDIDSRIVDLGRRLHPEHPYQDARVVPVVNDARAFFEQYRGPDFDVVCYGLLDSHAMFSALSSLRLDNYVYTEEGLRAAWRHVAPGGHLSVSFSVFGGHWLADRLYWTIARATGMRPVMLYHGMHYGALYLVARAPAALDLTPLRDLARVGPTQPRDEVRTTSDDWPFLYIRPHVFPWAYVTLLASVLVMAVVAARAVFGARALGSEFDARLFLMGAAFLLIETRGVTTLSLLFGSTWIVNAAVFAGVLLMALLANLYVQRRGAPPLDVCFVALLAAVAVLWAVPYSVLEPLPLPVRGVLGALLNALPVAFAGVIVSALLARARNPAAALASNLLGSVLGGCLEYLSMGIGLRALAALALALYLGALLVQQRTASASAA